MMKFDVANIDAAPGQKVTVTLTNIGTLPKAAMAHNFVLLKAGTDVTVFATAAMTHAETGYLPPEMAGNVIVANQAARPRRIGHRALHRAGGGGLRFHLQLPRPRARGHARDADGEVAGHFVENLYTVVLWNKSPGSSTVEGKFG